MNRTHRFVALLALLLAGCNKSLGGKGRDGGPDAMDGGPLTGLAGAPFSTGLGGVGGPPATGRGGIGGTAGTGPGGTGLVDCMGEAEAVEINCGPQLCGNGRRDTCVVPAYYNGFPCRRPLTEACDGANGIDGDACLTSGYGSGLPSCSADCTLDTSTCSGCLPAGGHVVRCADTGVTNTAFTTTMGASDEGIGLAWNAFDEDGRLTTEFEVLSPELVVTGSSRLEDPRLVDLVSSPFVAPLPAGWAVVQYIEPDLIVHTLNTTGVELARTTVASFPATTFVNGPFVVARPNGGPLIAWQIQDVIQVVVLSDDGRSVSPTRQIQYTGFDSVTTAYAGGAFYVGLLIQTPTNSSQLRLQRVELDGRPTTAINALPDVAIAFAEVVVGAADLQILYGAQNRTGPFEIFLQKIDQTGAPASTAALVPDPEDFSQGLAVAVGADTVIAQRRLGGPDVVRLGPTGEIVTPAFQVARLPNPNGVLMVARQGSDVVVAWDQGYGSRIELARVTP